MNAHTRDMLKARLHQSPGTDGGAAVALILLEQEDHKNFCDLEILFVKRVNNPTDPWSGQMALPGGKRELSDTSLTDTVIRETHEEVTMNLHECQFLGILKPHISTPRPDMKIYPYVFLCDCDVSVRVNPAELERHVWISIHSLQTHVHTVSFEFGTHPAFIVDETVIWGLTYRIVTHFFSLLESIPGV